MTKTKKATEKATEKTEKKATESRKEICEKFVQEMNRDSKTVRAVVNNDTVMYDDYQYIQVFSKDNSKHKLYYIVVYSPSRIILKSCNDTFEALKTAENSEKFAEKITVNYLVKSKKADFDLEQADAKIKKSKVITDVFYKDGILYYHYNKQVFTRISNPNDLLKTAKLLNAVYREIKK